MKKMRKAFTLAEVLIALTIIGVVSALTIPVLVQKTNKQEYVSALQKAYSVLSQAALQIIAEEGNPRADAGGWATDAANIYSLFKSHLSSAKECPPGTEGCWEQHNKNVYKNLKGNNSSSNWNIKTDANLKRLVLADGMQVLFADNYKSADCSKEGEGTTGICSWIVVDVNGIKGPNVYGRDVFQFVIKENGLFPMGCSSSEDLCVKNKTGQSCACKVLREGKMDY